MSSKILVIGAINLDISVKPTKPYIMHDSNIVDIGYDIGGVGANIATNLAKYGHTVQMLTVLGTGPLYEYVRDEMERRDVGLKPSVTKKDAAMNFYISILDENHDLYLGMNDMKTVDLMSIEAVASKEEYIRKAGVIVLDCNLPVATMQYVAALTEDSILVVDAVSAIKAKRVLPILQSVNILKMNRLEYETLLSLGFSPIQYPNLTAIVTNHEKPVEILNNRSIKTVSPPPMTDIVSTSGAGDALLSGVVHGIVSGQDIETAVKTGIQLAQKVLGKSASSWKE